MESKVVGALTTALCIEHSPVVSVATSLAVLVTSVASVVSYSILIIFFNAEKL